MRTIESITENECVQVDNHEQDLRFRRLMKAAGKKWRGGDDYEDFAPDTTLYNTYPHYHIPSRCTWIEYWANGDEKIIHCTEFFDDEQKGIPPIHELRKAAEKQIRETKYGPSREFFDNEPLFSEDGDIIPTRTEEEISEMIKELKDRGYKILKPTINYEEV